MADELDVKAALAQLIKDVQAIKKALDIKEPSETSYTGDAVITGSGVQVIGPCGGPIRC